MKALLEKIYAEAAAFGKDAVLQMNKGNKAAGARTWAFVGIGQAMNQLNNRPKMTENLENNAK